MSTSVDLEMNDVKAPLIEDQLDKVPEVSFRSSKQKLDDESGSKASETKAIHEEFHGLTKEELEKFAKDPFWKRLRLILFILFWVVWAGMLIAAILIVVFSPKCPKRPKLQFWEQKTGYWVDPFALADTNNDGVGDFNGIIAKLDYINKEVGAGYIILDPIFKGQYSSNGDKIGLVDSFREIDPALGNEESFINLIKIARKKGIEIILTADFNSLSSNSELIKNNFEKVLIPWMNNNWLGRNGKPAFKDYRGKSYYSTVNLPDMFDLNLKEKIVIKEIKDSVKFWLDKGVRGFLLTNIGLYTESFEIPITYSNYTEGTDWYRNRSMGGQIYCNETITFLKEIRNTMNEVAKSTDKSRLLIVESGDLGFGLEDSDNLIQYLGNNEIVADMVISREFLHNRGWKTNENSKVSSISNYIKMIPSDQLNKMGLTSATSTNMRTINLINLVAPFLVRGNPIIYYGSELNVICNKLKIDLLTPKVYPLAKSFPQFPSETSVKCNHMIMPWDNTGEGFYGNLNQTLDDYIKEATTTVQSLTAAGVGETILQLHQKLIKLREKESLRWGSISMFYENIGAKHSHQIFIRAAEGFPKIIVALLKDENSMGKVFSFESICRSKVVPFLIYPSNDNLKENVAINVSNVYLKIGKSESVHVFTCD